MSLAAELRALGDLVISLDPGVDRANAKHHLSYFVTANLPTIIAALEAQEKNDG